MSEASYVDWTVEKGPKNAEGCYIIVGRMVLWTVQKRDCDPRPSLSVVFNKRSVQTPHAPTSMTRGLTSVMTPSLFVAKRFHIPGMVGTQPLHYLQMRDYHWKLPQKAHSGAGGLLPARAKFIRLRGNPNDYQFGNGSSWCRAHYTN